MQHWNQSKPVFPGQQCQCKHRCAELLALLAEEHILIQNYVTSFLIRQNLYQFRFMGDSLQYSHTQLLVIHQFILMHFLKKSGEHCSLFFCTPTNCAAGTDGKLGKETFVCIERTDKPGMLYCRVFLSWGVPKLFQYSS